MSARGVRLGVVMDPISKIKPVKDSTLAMLLEAQRRGWELHYAELEDIRLRDGQAYGRLRPLEVRDDTESWHELRDPFELPLRDLDVILMRKDPPFNIEYIHATYILERAEAHGTLIVNRPQGLRDANEKVFTAWFPQCCAPTLVSRSIRDLRRFVDEHEKTVVKPLDGMGGLSIFVAEAGDRNCNVILETLTDGGQRFVMAQRYVPDILSTGDKRILLIDGEPVPYALARIPPQSDNRGNLAVGATSEGRELTERDRWIAEQVGPTLRDMGLMFAGIDVIGDYLTEINVTSPTCIRELDRAYDLNISARLMDAVERGLRK